MNGVIKRWMCNYVDIDGKCKYTDYILINLKYSKMNKVKENVKYSLEIIRRL